MIVFWTVFLVLFWLTWWPIKIKVVHYHVDEYDEEP